MKRFHLHIYGARRRRRLLVLFRGEAGWRGKAQRAWLATKRHRDKSRQMWNE